MTRTTSEGRRQALRTLAAGVGALALPAWAQAPTKIVFGYTAVTDFATVFIAREEGYFGKHGLDVEPKLIPLNRFPAAAVSPIPCRWEDSRLPSSCRRSTVAWTTWCLRGWRPDRQVDDGRRAGGAAGSNISRRRTAWARRSAFPGFGAYLHVGFRAWLKTQGVDYRKVTFVEAAFPQHGDLLRGGTLDAVVTADPFMASNRDSGTGYVRLVLHDFPAGGLPTLVYRRAPRLGAEEPGRGEGLPGRRSSRRARSSTTRQQRQGARAHRQVHQAAAGGAGSNADQPARAGSDRAGACLVGASRWLSRACSKSRPDLASLILK